MTLGWMYIHGLSSPPSDLAQVLFACMIPSWSAASSYRPRFDPHTLIHTHLIRSTTHKGAWLNTLRIMSSKFQVSIWPNDPPKVGCSFRIPTFPFIGSMSCYQVISTSDNERSADILDFHTVDHRVSMRP